VTEDGFRALEIAADLSQIAFERFAYEMEAAQQMVDAIGQTKLDRLQTSFDEAVGIINQIADKENELLSIANKRAQVELAREEKAFDLERMRFDIQNQANEMDASQLLGLRARELSGFLEGGLENERDIQRALGIAGEFQGLIGQARGQTLIGNEEALQKINQAETFFNRIYDAQDSILAAQEDAARSAKGELFEQLLGTDFAQETGFGAAAGVATLLTGDVAASDLLAGAQIAFAASQEKIQSEMRDTMNRIETALLGTLNMRLTEVENVADSVVTASVEELADAIAASMEIVHEQNLDPALAADIAAQLAAGITPVSIVSGNARGD
jgi:hypothetical protein